MIVRGTTPTISFKYTVIQPSTIAVAYLTMFQNGERLLEKDLTTAEVGVDTISWTLSQEETLAMTAGQALTIQCRYRLDDGSAYATKKATEDVLDVVKDGVI